MIEALVNQPQREHVQPQELGEERMGIQFGAEAVPGPQPTAGTIDQGIAVSFERQVLGKLPHLRLNPSPLARSAMQISFHCWRSCY